MPCNEISRFANKIWFLNGANLRAENLLKLKSQVSKSHLAFDSISITLLVTCRMLKTFHNLRLRFWNFITIRLAIQCANFVCLSLTQRLKRGNGICEMRNYADSAANANDYCGFKFIISPSCVPSRQLVVVVPFLRGFPFKVSAKMKKHKIKITWTRLRMRSIIQSRNEFFCQDSTGAINEIFMMFTQVYGAFRLHWALKGWLYVSVVQC